MRVNFNLLSCCYIQYTLSSYLFMQFVSICSWWHWVLCCSSHWRAASSKSSCVETMLFSRSVTSCDPRIDWRVCHKLNCKKIRSENIEWSVWPVQENTWELSLRPAGQQVRTSRAKMCSVIHPLEILWKSGLIDNLWIRLLKSRSSFQSQSVILPAPTEEGWPGTRICYGRGSVSCGICAQQQLYFRHQHTTAITSIHRDRLLAIMITVLPSEQQWITITISIIIGRSRSNTPARPATSVTRGQTYIITVQSKPHACKQTTSCKIHALPTSTEFRPSRQNSNLSNHCTNKCVAT